MSLRPLLAAVVTAAALGAPAPALANCHVDICSFCANGATCSATAVIHAVCDSIDAPLPVTCH